MRYLLDTNAWIHYLKHADSPVSARLRRTPAREVAVCSVVWAELLHGARKYEKRDERLARIERTLRPYRSLPFDDAAARRYAEIRDTLETSKIRKKIFRPPRTISYHRWARTVSSLQAELDFMKYMKSRFTALR